MINRILKVSRSQIKAPSFTHTKTRLHLPYLVNSRNFGFLTRIPNNTNTKNTEKQQKNPFKLSTEPNNKTIEVNSKKNNAMIAIRIAKCYSIDDIMQLYHKDNQNFNLKNFLSLITKVNLIHQENKNLKYKVLILESNFMDQVCSNLLNLIDKEGFNYDLRVKSNLFFQLANLHYRFRYNQPIYNDLVDIVYDLCHKDKQDMRNQEYSNFLLGLKYLERYDNLNQMCDEVCRNVVKMKTIAFCQTFEIYSKTNKIETETVNKLGMVLKEYSHIISQLSISQYAQLLIFISNEKLDQKLKEDIFEYFFPSLKKHLLDQNHKHLLILCKSLIYIGKFDKSPQIIKVIEECFKNRENELRYSPKVSQRILMFIHKHKENTPKAHSDIMMLLYSSILNTNEKIYDLYAYSDAILTIDANQIGQEQAVDLMKEFEQKLMINLPAFNNRKGNYQENIAKIMIACNKKKEIYKMDPEFWEMIIKVYRNCYSKINKRSTFYNFALVVVELAAENIDSIKNYTYNDLLDYLLSNGFDFKYKQDFFAFQMHRYLDCINFMVKASQISDLKEESRIFIEKFIMRVIHISSQRYMEEKGICGDSAKILKIMREEFGCDFQDEYTRYFGRVLKQQFLNEKSKFNLKANSENDYSDKMISFNTSDEEIKMLKEELEYFNL